MIAPTRRSSESIFFEVRLLSLALPETILDERKVTGHLEEFQPHVAIVMPDLSAGRLMIERAGQELNAIFGTNLVGEDYQDFVEPRCRAKTLALARSILEQPCGLWQVVEVRSHDTHPTWLESTLYPLRDAQGARTKIIAHGRQGRTLASHVVATQHVLSACWLNLGFGEPASI